MSDDFIQAAARILGESIAQPIYARLGDPTRAAGSNINAAPVTGIPGTVYVHARSDGEGGVSVVHVKPELSDRVMVFGTPVKLAYENGRLVLVGTDTRAALDYFAGVPVDTQNAIELDKLNWGLLAPTSPPSMRARVSSAVYRVGNLDYYIAPLTTANFSASPLDTSGAAITIPVAGLARGVLVQLDVTSGVLSYKQSTTFDVEITIEQALAAGLYPNTDSGKFRVGYIRLPAGVTSLQRGTHIVAAGDFLTASTHPVANPNPIAQVLLIQANTQVIYRDMRINQNGVVIVEGELILI